MSPSLPYTVVQTRDRGKCVIAARDIEAGELVLEDRPLLVTPLIKSKPQCLQCARSVIIYLTVRLNVKRINRWLSFSKV